MDNIVKNFSEKLNDTIWENLFTSLGWFFCELSFRGNDFMEKRFPKSETDWFWWAYNLGNILYDRGLGRWISEYEGELDGSGNSKNSSE